MYPKKKRVISMKAKNMIKESKETQTKLVAYCKEMMAIREWNMKKKKNEPIS